MKKQQSVESTDRLDLRAFVTLKVKVVALLVAASLVLGRGDRFTPSI